MTLSSIPQEAFDAYDLHISRKVYLREGCLLQTDRGLKMAHLRPSLADVNWSVSWRDVLAQQNLRQTNRMLRTKSGSAYVSTGNGYVTIDDVVSGHVLDVHSRLWSKLGEFTGKMFHVFLSSQLAETLRDHPLRTLNGRRTLGTTPDIAWQRTLQQSDSFFAAVVGMHAKSLTYRYTQASALFKRSKEHVPFFLSIPSLHLTNWVSMPEGCLFFTSHDLHPVAGFAPLASFLQHIYVQSDYSSAALHMFWDAFEQQCPLHWGCQYEILAHLIHPQPFFEAVRTYVHRQADEETSLQNWIKLCQERIQLDRVHKWYAERIDASMNRQEFGFV